MVVARVRLSMHKEREGSRLTALLIVQTVDFALHVCSTDNMITLVSSSCKENFRAVLDLNGQFTGRREDENADLSSLRLLRRSNEALNGRDQEGESLSSSCTGLGEPYTIISNQRLFRESLWEKEARKYSQVSTGDCNR